MKKSIQISSILLTLIVAFAFIGCEGDCPTDTNSNNSQIMFVYAEHDNSYWDEQNEEEIFQDNTTAGGVVFGNPLPEFTHLQLGETSFIGNGYSEIFPGYVSFGNFNGANSAMITSNFTPLDVEVKTSLGVLNGTITLPDTITTLTLSEYESLQIGESFTISWSGSNADFFSVSCDYEWVDENDNWQYEDLDEFIVGNSITYDGSIFAYNGEINYIRVQPMNGPFPENGAIGNMYGEGSGFLYYEVDRIYYEGADIIVGSGSYGRITNTFPKKPSEKTIQKRVRNQIESSIVGNQ